MEYIFIHAKMEVITKKNDGMKNPKETKSAKKWQSEKVLMNFFIHQKKR